MLTPDAMAITRADGNASLAAAGLSDMGKSMRPREATQRLATALRRGHKEVQGLRRFLIIFCYSFLLFSLLPEALPFTSRKM